MPTILWFSYQLTWVHLDRYTHRVEGHMTVPINRSRPITHLLRIGWLPRPSNRTAWHMESCPAFRHHGCQSLISSRLSRSRRRRRKSRLAFVSRGTLHLSPQMPNLERLNKKRSRPPGHSFAHYWLLFTVLAKWPPPGSSSSFSKEALPMIATIFSRIYFVHALDKLGRDDSFRHRWRLARTDCSEQ